VLPTSELGIAFLLLGSFFLSIDEAARAVILSAAGFMR
jgi:hypothetical protein